MEAAKHHIIKWRGVPGSAHVHHMILYGCPPAIPGATPAQLAGELSCMRTWAPRVRRRRPAACRAFDCSAGVFDCTLVLRRPAGDEVFDCSMGMGVCKDALLQAGAEYGRTPRLQHAPPQAAFPLGGAEESAYVMLQVMISHPSVRAGIAGACPAPAHGWSH